MPDLVIALALAKSITGPPYADALEDVWNDERHRATPTYTWRPLTASSLIHTHRVTHIESVVVESSEATRKNTE